MDLAALVAPTQQYLLWCYQISRVLIHSLSVTVALIRMRLLLVSIRRGLLLDQLLILVGKSLSLKSLISLQIDKVGMSMDLLVAHGHEGRLLSVGSKLILLHDVSQEYLPKFDLLLLLIIINLKW